MDRHAAISASGSQLEADLGANILRIGPGEVIAHIRDGSLTMRCETGIDEDRGRHRPAFFLGTRRARLVIGGDGRILHTSCTGFGDPVSPRARGAVRGVPPS